MILQACLAAHALGVLGESREVCDGLLELEPLRHEIRAEREVRPWKLHQSLDENFHEDSGVRPLRKELVHSQENQVRRQVESLRSDLLVDILL